MSILGLLQMGLLAWLLFIAIASLITASVYPFIRGRLKGLVPEIRAVALRALCVAPVVGGLVATILCFVPTAFGGIVPRVDHCVGHCPDHGDGHLHFCMTHPPQTWGESGLWLLIVGLGLGYLTLVSIRLARFVRSHRVLRQLTSTARFDANYDAWVVESGPPLAITVGVLHKRTVLSSGLLLAIPSRLVEAIVAHEKAHERRHDAFWRAVTRFLSLGHVPATRRALQADLELTCEQACDEEAGSSIGDRLRVAEALIAVARVRQDAVMFGSAVMAFAAQGLDARIESLLASPARSVWSRSFMLGLVATGVLVALVLADPLHHFAETLLGLLVG